MKKKKLLGLMAMSAVLLTGCIDSMPDMTDEQSALVAEYAAGLLLKYSPEYDYMLVSDDELADALAQEAAGEEETAREASEENESTEPASVEEARAETEETQQPKETEAAFADADTDLALELGFDEPVTLRYQSFELYDSYPQSFTGFSGIEAGEGKKLLVMHFDLENTTDEELECELFDYMLKVRIDINGAASISAQDTSMLPNDMATFVGSIDAGAREDVVAIAEIDAMSDEDIETLAIQISSQSSSCNIKVR
ncbi:MAG: hypothetical protein LUE96_06105 [Lachnospiraceae bacterium]|nr:hypothetical protein [Lachnospiraceae bacterium]